MKRQRVTEERPYAPLSKSITAEAVDGGYFDDLFTVTDIEVVVERVLEEISADPSEEDIRRAVSFVVNETGLIKRMRNRLVYNLSAAIDVCMERRNRDGEE